MKNRLTPSREYRGLTPEALASQLGVTPATLALWESGEANPSVEQAVQLSKLLDLPVGFLFCVAPREGAE